MFKTEGFSFEHILKGIFLVHEKVKPPHEKVSTRNKLQHQKQSTRHKMRFVPEKDSGSGYLIIYFKCLYYFLPSPMCTPDSIRQLKRNINIDCAHFLADMVGTALMLYSQVR